MSLHFYRVVSRAGVSAADTYPRTKAIRLWCVQHGSWYLQACAPRRLGTGHIESKEGKGFLVATAALDRDTLVALRDACDVLLEET